MADISTALQINDGVSSVFRNMANSINVCLGAFEEIHAVTAEGIVITQYKEARLALREMNYEAQDFVVETEAAEGQQEKVNEAMKKGTGAAEGLVRKFKSFASEYLNLQNVKNILGMSDELTQTMAKLNRIVGSEKDMLALQDQIYVSAQRSRTSYTDMADTVAGLASGTGDTFSDSHQTLAFAENLNKSFLLAGASQQEVAAATEQLTGALSSGKLSGEALQAVPGMLQNIADYTGEDISAIQGMADAGKITADIVKNAMLAATEDINEQFQTLPMTWEQVGTNVSNMAQKAFQPMLESIRNITKMEEFEVVMGGIAAGFQVVAAIVTPVIDGLINGAAFLIENWDMVSPIIYGVAAAMGAYVVAATLYNAVETISNTIKAVSAVASAIKGGQTLAEAAATTTATGAQIGLNAALLACPLTWIIIAIIAVIAIIYMVVAAINHFKDASISGTGVVAGIFATLGAQILNVFIIPVINAFVNFANLFANFFKSPVASVQIMFLEMAQNVIGYVMNIATAIEKLLNNIPGIEVDITSGLDHLYDTVHAASEEIKDKSGWEAVFQKVNYIDYETAWDTGYSAGEGLENKLKSFQENFSLGEIGLEEDPFTGMPQDTSITAENTGRMADSMEISEEDMQYLRDIAEREVIDRTVFSAITVEMGGVTNAVHNMNDLDAIPQYLADTIQEQMSISAEGVYQNV